MRGEELLDKMELIDASYVEAADAVKKAKKTAWVWLRWGAIAACLVLMIGVGIRYIPRKATQGPMGVQNIAELPDLPKLMISETMSSMGYEGYMAFDVSELVSANPWNEKLTISTLPVFKNQLTYETYAWASGADFDKMQALLLDVAGRLGMDTEAIKIRTNEPTPEEKEMITEKFEAVGDTVPDGYFTPTMLIAEEDGIEIEVDQELTVTVRYDPAIELPAKYNFTHFASYKDVKKAARYLKSEYADLIGMEKPQTNIYGGDYTYSAEQHFYISFFEGSGSIEDQIINYNFNQVHFHCDDEGKLFITRFYQPDLSEKAGDYPVISTMEAEKLLSEGYYITTVPYEMPGVEYIRKVELIYRTSPQETYYMPYYRFYVELPEEKRDNGLKDYGAYYVPAVHSTYIENMPTWEGSFYGGAQ